MGLELPPKLTQNHFLSEYKICFNIRADAQ